MKLGPKFYIFLTMLVPPLGYVGLLMQRGKVTRIPSGHIFLSASALFAFGWLWKIFSFSLFGAFCAMLAIAGAYTGFAVICESVSRSTKGNERPIFFLCILAIFQTIASIQVTSTLYGTLDIQACSRSYTSLFSLFLFISVSLMLSGLDIYAKRDFFFKEVWEELDLSRGTANQLEMVDKTYFYLSICAAYVLIEPFFSNQTFNILHLFKCL